MQDQVRERTDPDSIKATFMWKLPAYILGIIFGFIVVQIAISLFGAA